MYGSFPSLRFSKNANLVSKELDCTIINKTVVLFPTYNYFNYHKSTINKSNFNISKKSHYSFPLYMSNNVVKH